MGRQEQSVPFDGRVFILNGRVDPSTIARRVSAKLPATLERYAHRMDADWRRAVLKFQELRLKETFVYFAASFAYADLPVGKTFEVVFPLSTPEAMVRSDSEIVAAIHEWVPLPIPFIDAGHRSICLLNFPDGIPAIVRELPLTDNIGGHRQSGIIVSSEEAWRAFVHRRK